MAPLPFRGNSPFRLCPAAPVLRGTGCDRGARWHLPAMTSARHRLYAGPCSTGGSRTSRGGASHQALPDPALGDVAMIQRFRLLRFRAALPALVLVLATILPAATPAHAATLTVTTTAD